MGTLLSSPQRFPGSVLGTTPNDPPAARHGILVLQKWPTGMGPKGFDTPHLLPWDAWEMLKSRTSTSCQNTCQKSERITFKSQMHRK